MLVQVLVSERNRLGEEGDDEGREGDGRSSFVFGSGDGGDDEELKEEEAEDDLPPPWS